VVPFHQTPRRSHRASESQIYVCDYLRTSESQDRCRETGLLGRLLTGPPWRVIRVSRLYRSARLHQATASTVVCSPTSPSPSFATRELRDITEIYHGNGCPAYGQVGVRGSCRNPIQRPRRGPSRSSPSDPAEVLSGRQSLFPSGQGFVAVSRWISWRAILPCQNVKGDDGGDSGRQYGQDRSCRSGIHIHGCPETPRIARCTTDGRSEGLSC
jgi:hypothetical protein